MWKFIILILAGFVLYKMFVNDSKRKSKQSDKETERLKATGELVKDPACGAYVSLNSDIRLREGETVHRFCSYECRDSYLKRLEASQPKEAKPEEAKPEEAKSEEAKSEDREKPSA